MGIIFELTLFNLDAGTCSEVHSGIKILTADGQRGYEYFLGAYYNTQCSIYGVPGTDGASKSALKIDYCSGPMKCNEVRIDIFPHQNLEEIHIL